MIQCPRCKEVVAPDRLITVRQQQILEMLAKGRGTRQIAQQLNVSVKSVEAHYKNLKRLLSLQTLNELIVFAVKDGCETKR